MVHLLLPALLMPQSDTLLADAKLNVPISLHVKNKAISEVFKEVSAETKVNLSALKVYSDLKVTVFVDNEPANVVLSKIADVLMAEWRPMDAGGYRFAMPNATVAQRNIYMDREAALMREVSEGMIKKMVNDARNRYQTLSQKRAVISRELNPPGGQSKLSATVKQDLQGQLLEIEAQMQPNDLAISNFFANANSQTLSKFWNGTPAYAQGFVPNSAGVFVKYDPNSGFLALSVGSISQAVSQAKEDIESRLSKLGFAKEISSWPEFKPDTNDERVKKSIKLTESKEPHSVADVLQSVYEQSGISVVSDGFRIGTNLTASGSDLVNFAKSFGQQVGYAKVSGHFLEFRHQNFWRLQREEIPEAKFNTYEAAARPDRATDFEAAVEFVAGLTVDQLRNLATKRVPTTANLGPIISAWPALRLYSTLSKEDRLKTTSSLGIRFHELTSVQQALFVDAIYESAFPPFGQQSAAVQVMSESNDPRRFLTLGLRVMPGSNGGNYFSLGEANTGVTYRTEILSAAGSIGSGTQRE